MRLDVLPVKGISLVCDKKVTRHNEYVCIYVGMYICGAIINAVMPR